MFKKLFIPTFFYTLLLFLIEFLVQSNKISKNLIPAPTELFQLLFVEPQSLYSNFLSTATYTLIAFSLASLLAFLVALFIHYFQSLKNIVLPFSLFLQTVPIVAIAPLLVIYFGFGSMTTLTSALIVSFFPVFAATLVGLQQVQLQHLDLFLFLKISRFKRLLNLEIPSALPTILAGLKTSAGLAVIGVVSGEFVAGGGLGSLIDSARLQQRVDLVFASLILLSILGLSLMKLVDYFFHLIFAKYLVR